MWRALVFIGLLCVAAFGAVWLADRPGTVLITFAGYEIQMSVAVGAIALVGLALFAWAFAVFDAARSVVGFHPDESAKIATSETTSRAVGSVKRSAISGPTCRPISTPLKNPPNESAPMTKPWR